MNVSRDLLLAKIIESAPRHNELTQQLLDKAMEFQKAKGANPQNILDTQFFNDLPLEHKVDFISNNRDKLAVSPRLNWKSALAGGAAVGSYSGLGTLGYQAIKASTGKGSMNPWVIGIAAGLGGVTGALMNLREAKKNYNRDVVTKENLDNAIAVLVNRSMTPRGNYIDLGPRSKEQSIERPLALGKALSDIDFSSLDKKN